MKIIKVLFVIFGITLIGVALSVKLFPDWLTIPGGLLILIGLAFNTVLDIGDKISGWVDLLFAKGKDDDTPKLQYSYGDIHQQGNSNIVATNIEHLEIHNSPDSVNSHPELEQAIFQEIRFACHSWKNIYMSISPEFFNISDGKRFSDIWEMMIEISGHHYSVQEWKRFIPLFDQAITSVIQQLDNITQSYSMLLPPEIKVLILQTKRQLQAERTVYLQLGNKNESIFDKRFAEVSKVLAELDHAVSKPK
jgi:hypothetical protein